MSEHTKANQCPKAKKTVNMKITDSLQSRKKVSWGVTKRKKDSLSDMEICEVDPIPKPFPNPVQKRSISQLFSEFNLTSSTLSSLHPQPETFQVNRTIPVQPTPRPLAPVVEESESNQSSGQHISKKTNFDQFDPSSKQSIQGFDLMAKKKIVWGGDKGKPHGLQVRSGQHSKGNRESSLQYWRDQLDISRKTFFEFQKECFKVLTIAECIETKLEMLNKAHRIVEPSNSLLNFQDFYKSIDFTLEPYKFEERWIKTWTKGCNGTFVTYYRHLGSYYLNEIIGKLVISLWKTGTNEVQVDIELFASFGLKNLQNIWEGYKLFLIKILGSIPAHEVLEKASRYWINFVEFSGQLELFDRSFNYDKLHIEERRFQLNGTFSGKPWTYLCTYCHLSEGLDLMEEILKEINE